MTTRSVATSGRGWAYTGTILGGAVSIAANVAHSFIPPTGSSAGWTPEPGAVVGAIVWPVFLFIAVEILARVAWPRGPWWYLLRFGGMVPVALVAAFVSYRHLSGLLGHYGEEPIVCVLGPLAVDGLMVMATSALLATSAARHRALAAASATADVPTAAPVLPVSPTPARPSTPRKTAAKPATAKPTAKAAPRKTTPAKTAPAPAPTAPSPAVPPAGSDTLPSAPLRESATTTATPAPAVVPVAPAASPAPSTTDHPVATVAVAQPTRLPVPAALLTRARHIAESHRASAGTPITAGELAVRMRVNSDAAAQILAVLDLAPDSPTRPTPAVNGSPAAATR